jgi:serine protease Do
VKFSQSHIWIVFILTCRFTTTSFAQTEAESLSASFRKASRRVLPSVVTVRTFDVKSPFDGVVTPNNNAQRKESGGSGVVIDADKGFVLTNHHVIEGATRVVVVLHGGKERPVKSIRRDPKSDLALLVIDPKSLEAATWGDSETIDTGDWVLAIGQPFGLSDTVTAGIISGKGRGVGLALYEDLIQTDAAINPGNSGGPLINLKGEVIGINTAIKSVGGGYEGVGFAVPASRARRVAADLAEFGIVRRAFVGINVRRADAKLLETLDQDGAVIITAVAQQGPATEAGLRPGDLILKIDGKVIAGPGPLQAVVEVAKVGQPLLFTIQRDGKNRDLKVVPRAQPEQFGLPPVERPE